MDNAKPAAPQPDAMREAAQAVKATFERWKASGQDNDTDEIDDSFNAHEKAILRLEKLAVLTTPHPAPESKGEGRP